MLKNTIQIITPSRLHFGFIELNNSCHSKFGGIGLSIDKFHTKIIIKKNTKMKLKSKVSNKAQFFLTKFCSFFQTDFGCTSARFAASLKMITKSMYFNSLSFEQRFREK